MLLFSFTLYLLLINNNNCQEISKNGSGIASKQNLQQLQVVVVPSGSHAPHPNAPAAPGYIWVQIPAENNFPIPPTPPPITVSTPSPITITTPQIFTQPLYLPETTTNAGDVSKCLRPRGQFPSTFCNKYVNCWDGHAIEQSCPENLLFNPKGFCDYPHNVNCKGRPVEGEITDTSSIHPSTTPSIKPTTSSHPSSIATLTPVNPNLKKKCLKPRGQFPSYSCNKYVNCWDDVVIEQECPDGLLFSSKGYCDYPHRVTCQHSPPPRSNDNAIMKECPADYGTFRDRMNCSNYFTCVAGKKLANYSCPIGFKFNDNIGVCDYEHRVDCSKEPLIFQGGKRNLEANFFNAVQPDILKKMDNCIPGTVFPHNPQCTSASICRDGLTEIVQCPQGLAYDSKIDKCILLHLAKC